MQQGEQAYHLKLAILLTILQANQQTGKVWTHVSPGLLGKLGRGDNAPCTIELTLVNGQVTTALILRRGHILAQGEAALAAARKCDELSWVVRSVSPQSAPTAQKFVDPAIERSQDLMTWSNLVAPQLTRPLTPQEMGRLPRKHRQVLLLIDGRRGISELSRMLNCAPDQLTLILKELLANKLIFFSQ